MKKDLLRRLEKLEAEQPVPVVGVFWVFRFADEDRAKMTAEERIVEDWFFYANHSIRNVRERITSDPGDPGQNYLSVGKNQWRADPRIHRKVTFLEDSGLCQAIFSAEELAPDPQGKVWVEEANGIMRTIGAAARDYTGS